MLCARCVLHKNALRTPSAVQKNELEPSLAYPRSVTLDLTSVTLLGPGPLAPIQPPCLPLKRAVGTQTLAHPHPALIHASLSVIERFARAYLQAAAADDDVDETA